MMLPFTVEQFLAVFVAYNAAIWPTQVLAYALAAVAVGALWLGGATGKRVICGVLALFWAVNGVGYHLLFFARINPLATGFAAAFVAQAVLFAVAGLKPEDLRFDWRGSVRTGLAALLIAYAMLGYEALGVMAGHGLMAGPLIGVAPCPTTIFTIGMLLLARGRRVVWLAVIPLAWSVIGLAAAVQLTIAEDFVLPAAGAALVVALLVDRAKRRTSVEARP